MRNRFQGVCESGSQLPMDLIGNALGAWSLTRLSAKYISTVLTVRRSSDNATTDVYYDSSGKISSTSTVTAGGNLTSWAGASTLFVTSVFDLTGNGRNCSNATVAYQPTLILNSLNGQAIMRFAGGQRLDASSAFNVTFNVFFSIHNIPSSAVRGVVFGNFVTTNNAENIEKTTANFSRVYVDGSDLLAGTTATFCGQDQVFSFVRNPTVSTSTSFESNTLDKTVSSVNGPPNNAIIHSIGADQRNVLPTLSIPLTGDICTIVVYQTQISLTTRTVIARSLGHLAGLNI